MTTLEQDIYRVIAYFSFFSYPLTAFEIWKWQFQPKQAWSYVEILSTLQSSKSLSRHVNHQEGFYGFGDIASQVDERHHRFFEAVRKYKKLQWVLQYVTRIPSVEGVAICNSLSYHFARKESDIDLFLIVNDGRVWSTRFMAVVPLLLLRQRPGEAKQSPVDMSFFVTKSHLDLSNHRLDEGDPYFSYWLRSLVPLYERHPGVFTDVQRTNAWSQKDLPMSEPIVRARSVRFSAKKNIPWMVSERLAKKLSIKQLPSLIRERMNQDSRVVVTDQVLKFHTVDRREEIREHLVKHEEVCRHDG